MKIMYFNDIENEINKSVDRKSAKDQGLSDGLLVSEW